MSFLRLQYTRSDGEVDTYHLKSGRRYHVGRGSACEVRILDMRLSRKHCALEFIDGEWLVADLGSTNGCKVEKQRIQESKAVGSNTVVTLGSVDILIASISDHLDDESVAADEYANDEAAVVESNDDDFAPSSDDKSETFAGPLSDNIEETVDADQVEESEAENQAVESEEKASDSKGDDLFESDEDESGEDESDEAKSRDNEKADSQVSEYNPTTSAIKAPEKTSQEETKTVFISALGKKVGPLTRTQARELKKRELKGALTEKELEQFIDEST